MFVLPTTNINTESEPGFVSFLLILDQSSGFEELETWLADVDFGNFTFAICGGLRTDNYWLDNSTRLNTLKRYGKTIPVTSFMASMLPVERESIIEQLIENWIVKVGYSPKGFFDFQPDTYTLDFMAGKNVSYVVGYCFDQYSTDWMSERGGWQLPYYAHHDHALKPNMNSSGLVVFPHLCWDWSASFTVTHQLCTHPLGLKEAFNENMTRAETYFYDLIDGTLDACDPFGFVSVQYEWCWAGITGGISDYARNWTKNLLNTRPYIFWTYEDTATWFRTNYAKTPDYSVDFVSPYNNDRIEWFYCQTFRVARANGKVVSYVQYDEQGDDSFLTSFATVDFSSPATPRNCIDTSLNFTIDALGGGLYRNPITDDAVAFKDKLKEFPQHYGGEIAVYVSPLLPILAVLIMAVALILHARFKEWEHVRCEALRIVLRGAKGFLAEYAGAVFVVGFQVLFLTAACLLIRGDPALASEVATYAYYLLGLGIALQAVLFMKGKRESNASE